MNIQTGKTKAWLPSHGGPEILKLTGDKLVTNLSYASNNMTLAGWVLAGEATISVELVNTDQLIENKVAALKKELQLVRANAERQAMDIEGKIQNLLAITYEVQE